jgi:hypothetical protein
MVISALGIGVSRQIDFRPPTYIPAIVHDRFASAASPGASAARILIRRYWNFVADFQRLRRLDGPRFQRDGIIA